MSQTQRAFLVAIFLLGLALRSYKRDTLPKHNETIDEYAWAWSGMTLLHEGTPKAWSYLGCYHALPWVTWRDHGYKIVRPWLDHPPLFSVVMGAWMVMGGYRDIFTVDLSWMRWMPWMLFILDFWLLARFLRRYFSDDEVLLGLLMLAVSPLVVVDQKLVICENWLLAVYLFTHSRLLDWSETKKPRHLWGVALGAFALPFSKVAAIGYSLYLGVLALTRRDRTLALAVTAGTLAGIGGYVLWGWYYDWHWFKEVMYSQSTRYTGLGSLFELVFAHKMVSTKWLYYPFYLGLFTVFFGTIGGEASGASRDAAASQWRAACPPSIDEKAREYYLQYPIYIGGLLMLVDSTHIYGWYLIPMYPVLCMGLAQYLLRMIRRQDPRYLLGFVVVCVPYTLMMLEPKMQQHLSLLRYLYLGLFLAAVALATFVRDARLHGWTARILVAGLVVGDVGWMLTR